jgi:hypothetical protein
MSTRIIAMVVDVHNLTLYKEDGETIVIAQGDYRVEKLVSLILPAIEANGEYFLEDSDMQAYSPFREAETALEGLVTFFKAGKAKIEEIMARFSDPTPRAALSVGSVPVKLSKEKVAEVLEQAAPTRSQAAVAEIMAAAVPSSDPSFGAKDLPHTEETTIVAVLSDGSILPGMENLDVQMRALVAGMGSGEGVANFFIRLTGVKRQHAVADLLKFMQKGELPIADDGSILVYKRLNRTAVEGVFVDCHSGNVKQRVGSHVFMDEKLVDANRSQECSNGLHVARRDYLNNFSGNVCILAKLAPEDVIAVPHRDARKLRAKGYHIIAELSQADHDNVCSNRPLQDTALLGNAASGNHVGILETVEITAGHGGGLIVKPVAVAPAAPVEDNGRRAESLDSLPIKGEEVESSVDPKAVAMRNAPATVVMADTEQKTLYNLVVALSDPTDAKKLLALKKAKKKGWVSLGLPADTGELCEKVVNAEAAATSLPKAVPPNDDKVLKAMTPAPVKTTPNKPALPVKAPVAVATAVKVVSKAELAAMSQVDKAAYYYDVYKRQPNKANAAALVAFKKAAKKSWTMLGLDDTIGKRMVDKAK